MKGFTTHKDVSYDLSLSIFIGALQQMATCQPDWENILKEIRSL